jgi:tetratricopeptide (TPR) repeat protein
MGPPEYAPGGIDLQATSVTGEDPVRVSLWRAWALPLPLRERVERIQRAGLSAGIDSLDAPARALLLEPAFGSPLERAELAVELAPGLPAAHAALAKARFDAWQLGGALAAFEEAIEAARHHLEARLWLEANAHAALFAASFAGALGFLALAALAAFPRFARDLSRLRELPAPSAAALAVAIVLVPAALGEGLAGLGLGLITFALVNGSAWRRLWSLCAAVLLLAALFPLLERRAESHAALALDPLTRAVWATEQGTPSAVDLARVVRAAESDPFAARALALRLARQGELEEAASRFAALRREDGSAELLANSAAVSLLRGDTEGAIATYEQAVQGSSSALLRFNLAQAYGRAIRFDAQDLALAEAQSLDPDVLVNLNRRYNGQDGVLVAYLPVTAGSVLERLHDPDATRFLTTALRARLAPGVLGESRGDAVVALWLAAAAGLLLGAVLRRLAGPEEDLYADIARLLQAQGGDSVARMAQLEELRVRQRRVERAADLAAWLVPGAAGMVAGRPLLALLSATVFAGGAAVFLHRHGIVPDPLALGALPMALTAALLSGLALAYLALLVLALWLRERV